MILGSVYGFWIIPQDPTQPRHFVLSPPLKYLSPETIQYPILSRLVYTDQKVPPFNPAGAILVYQSQLKEYKEDVVERFRNSGIKALVVQMFSEVDAPGYGESVIQPPLPDKAPFPVFEITIGQTRGLAGWFANQTARGVIALFQEEEANPWHHAFTVSFPTIAVVLLFTSGITLTMSVYKLTLLLLVKGFQLSIAQIVLALTSFSLVIRVIWCIVDPFGVYQRATFAWVQVGLTFPFSFDIGTTLLIALYWHEMIERTGKKVHMFLHKMFVPFLIVVGMLVTWELVTSLLRGYRFISKGLIIANSSVYAVITSTVLVFFIITKIRLTRLFDRLSAVNSTRGRRLTMTTNIVICLGIIMTIWIIPMILIAALPQFWLPKAYTVIWIFLLFGGNLICFLQVLLIRAPSRPWRWIFCGLFMKNPEMLVSDSDGTTSKPGSKPSLGSKESNNHLRSMNSSEM
jgi:hypothetical protein